jgi:ferredoxin
MRAKVDLDKCDGYANCVVEAERVFDVDPASGRVVVLLDPVPEAFRDEVMRAVASCPVAAIHLAG